MQIFARITSPDDGILVLQVCIFGDVGVSSRKNDEAHRPLCCFMHVPHEFVLASRELKILFPSQYLCIDGFVQAYEYPCFCARLQASQSCPHPLQALWPDRYIFLALAEDISRNPAGNLSGDIFRNHRLVVRSGMEYLSIIKEERRQVSCHKSLRSR